MLDLLDLYLLRRGIPSDDRTLTFRRIDGSSHSCVIYFLPWHTPYQIARQAGFAPLDFLAAYEMPPAIVSSDPELCVMAVQALVDDAARVLRDHGIASADATIVGLSVGNLPAIYLANRLGARLCSVAGADRADLMIWESPAARVVKRRAQKRGFRLADYTSATKGYHPIENLTGVHRESVFIVGSRDPFVPPSRSAALLAAIEMHAPCARVVTLDAGHVRTLKSSSRHQREMFGDATRRRLWRVRLPFRSRPGIAAPASGAAVPVPAIRPGS